MEDAQIYGHSICDNNNGEEDYIELEVIGSSNSTISLFHFKKISPPPQNEVARSSEFEFQMLSNFIDRNTTADELFYNGKLLPLDHIPLHNNPITNTFLHVGKNIVDFEQTFSTPYLQSCNLSQENYFFKYSTNDESSKKSRFLHVNKKIDDFQQSFSTPFCQFCHVSRKLNQEDYSTKDESSKTSKFLHVAKKVDFLEQSFSTPCCQSCHISRNINQEDYSTNDESSKLFHVSKSFDDFDQSLNTPFCQSCHVSRKLNNQEEYYYSTDDDQSSSKTSKILHVSKSFDDSKQSISTPFFQSCHVSGELNNQEDYFFGYSTDCESSRKSKWPKVPLTRKLRLIKQLSFHHSKIKCLINNSVKLVAKNDFFGKIHHKKSSFSGAIKKLLTTKSCSSKNSTHENIQEMHLLVRNKDHDVYTEVDPIQAAIAHCKNSHQVQKKFNSRKSNVSDTIGLGRSLSASRVIFEEPERIDLCRG